MSKYPPILIGKQMHYRGDSFCPTCTKYIWPLEICDNEHCGGFLHEDKDRGDECPRCDAYLSVYICDKCGEEYDDTDEHMQQDHPELAE